ncbi:unnamed protein product [Peniophora sp. CBMAI 1063]|nr:unnamed protein product [Peniophora sp. CBMAI 1063]
MTNTFTIMDYVQAYIGVSSFLSLSFGPDVAWERANRFVYASYTRWHPPGIVPHDPSQALFAPIQPSFGVPSHSILFAISTALSTLHFSDIRWQSHDGGQTFSRYCTLDMIAPSPSHVIPSRIFRPYNGTRRRGAATMENTDMLPIFFTQTNGLRVGVSIAESADLSVIPDVPTRITRSTVKVLLHLRNYGLEETQVRLRNNTTGPNVTARQLARQVAAATRIIIRKAAAKEVTLMTWEDARWRFGSGPGCIRIEDVEVVGVIFVSPGKVTPMLQLRPDFVPSLHLSLQ